MVIRTRMPCDTLVSKTIYFKFMKTFLFTKRIPCNISINSNNIYSRFLSDSFNSKDNSNIQEQVEHNKD